MITLFLTLAVMQATAPTTPPAATTPRPQAQTQARRPAAATAVVEIRVTDRTGRTIADARVSAEGPTSRDGKSDGSGFVAFRNMSAGTYRLRAEADGFFTFEKEVALRNGPALPVELSLSPAPPPPAPTPAPEPVAKAETPAPVAAAPAGEARVLSLTDMAERSLSGRDAVRTVPIGCSGQSNAQLRIVRESLQSPAQAETDDMLYVIAGEGTLSMGGRSQPLTPGWFTLVPRGSSATVTRKGRNPIILLSVLGGPLCGAGSSGQ